MSSPADSSRLFFALWPDDAVRSRLELLINGIGRVSGGKAIPRDNLHITLHFLGPVAEEDKGRLVSACGELFVPTFAVTLDRFGLFRHSGILWIGPSRIPDPLRQLHRGLGEVLQQSGREPEGRPFSPHVTLFRKALRLPRIAELSPLTWQVKSFVLVRSTPEPEGSRYEIVREWPLVSSRPRPATT